MALGAAGLVAAALGVDVLGDLTQTRPDARRPGWRSEVVFEVRSRDPERRPVGLAGRLWSSCQHTAERTLDAPGVVDLGGDMAKVVVRPALGTHARQRLKGCLEDLTLDRVMARVVDIRDLPPG